MDHSKGAGRRGSLRNGLMLAALVVVVALGTATTPVQAASPTGPAGFYALSQVGLGPGIEHVRLRQDSPLQEVNVARMAPELGTRVRVMLAHDQVAGSSRFERPSAMCLRVRCQVAVNGDFNELTTYGSVGTVVTGGELVRTAGIRMALFSLDDGGRPQIGHHLDWHVGLSVAGRPPLTVDAVNRPRAADSLVLFTPRFGPSTLTNEFGRELVLELVDGRAWGRVPAEGVAVRLVELRPAGNTAVGPGRLVLSGHGRGAAILEDLWQHTAATGDRGANLQVSTAGVAEMIGGSPVLVSGGQWAFPDSDDSFTRGRHPRTMVGWTATGELLMVTVDGRQAGHSAGMSLAEAAELLVGLGAVEGMNLDGGGSTAFVVDSTVRNRPSDAGNAERSVSSALVVLPPPGSVATASPRSNTLACPPGQVTPSGFLDVGPGNPHGTAVDCALAWGLTNGAGNGTYLPYQGVSRAQMASFIARLVEHSGGTLPASESAPDRYPDDGRSVHHDSINRLAEAGIVAGRADGTYGPDDTMTRAQMASLLVRAYGYRTGQQLVPTADYFADDTGGTHEPAINALAFGGFTGGKSHPHLYAPAERVQRDQMATFVTRVLDRLVDEGYTAWPPPG